MKKTMLLSLMLAMGLIWAGACAPTTPAQTPLSPTPAAQTATQTAAPLPQPSPTPAQTAAALPGGAGISWPEDQYLPRFDSFDTLHVADLSQGVEADEITLFAALQGLVNRAKPRIYLLYAAEEGPTTWLDDLAAVRRIPVTERWSLLDLYKNEVKGIVIYNPAVPDTLNLATTIAGVQDGVPASPALAARLTAEPYNFKILADLRELAFEDRAAVYQYAYDTFGAQTNQRLTLSLDPAIAGNLRDYAVALRALVVWLDPRIPTEDFLLRQIMADTPPTAPFIGYFPNPTNGGEAIIIRYLSWLARPSFAMDVFQNATVFGGAPRSQQVQTIPAKPALESKIYVTFFISDGDNAQYIQHKMRALWDDPKRGAVPIGWTFQPAMTDIAPNMLAYYLSHASALDVLVAGPSGLGYTYPNDWKDSAALTRYAALTQTYMRQSGLRIITLWDAQSNELNSTAGAIYAAGLPDLLGVTHQNWLNFGVINEQLPQIGLHPAYGASEVEVGRAIAIAAAAAGAAAQTPVFVAAQVNAWEMTPTNLYNIMQTLQAENSEMVFVRPDHFFMLAREANGLPADPSE